MVMVHKIAVLDLNCIEKFGDSRFLDKLDREHTGNFGLTSSFRQCHWRVVAMHGCYCLAVHGGERES